jgi:hypothetical protein
MLELRPTCENCNKPLPPNAADAMICTFECTFCKTCVDEVIKNVCPSCAGGLTQRPVRPATAFKPPLYLGERPASTKVKHRPVDREAHAKLLAQVGTLPAEKR